jgi:hypothetical protein
VDLAPVEAELVAVELELVWSGVVVRALTIPMMNSPTTAAMYRKSSRRPSLSSEGDGPGFAGASRVTEEKATDSGGDCTGARVRADNGGGGALMSVSSLRTRA